MKVIRCDLDEIVGCCNSVNILTSLPWSISYVAFNYACTTVSQGAFDAKHVVDVKPGV